MGAHQLDRGRRPRRFGYQAMPARIAQHFDSTVDTGFAHDGTIREKYNVISGNANVQVSAGYKENVIGFGWTNGVYLKMKAGYGKGGFRRSQIDRHNQTLPLRCNLSLVPRRKQR